MINKFQLYCGKLQWPLAVQIEIFVRILSMPLRQFVMSRAHLTFAEVTESAKTYQELIEYHMYSKMFHLIILVVHSAMSHMSHWIGHRYVPL